MCAGRAAARAAASGTPIVEEMVDSGVGAGPKVGDRRRPADQLVPLSGETETAARVVTGHRANSTG